MIVPQQRTAIRNCREHFAKRSKPSQRSSGSGFGKKQSAPALPSKKQKHDKFKSSKDDDLIFTTHFSNYNVSKQDMSNLLSMCHEMQQSSMQWADSCILITTDNEQHLQSETGVVATKDRRRGDIVTLVPIHGLGLRNVRESRDGVEYKQFYSQQDKILHSKDSTSVVRVNIPLNSEEAVFPITGGKPFIRLFIMSLPSKEVVPGWLSSCIQSTTIEESSNCVLLPIPLSAPFCAIVATKDIKEGQRVICCSQPLPMSDIEELNIIVEEEHCANISKMRSQIQKALLGPFHSINLQYPGVKRVHNDPDVFEVEGFLSDVECDEIIAAARSNLKPIRIYNKESGEYEQSQRRTNTVASMTAKDTPAIRKLIDLARCGESIDGVSVLNYQSGQEVKPHTDHAIIERLKQFRVGVAFVYLNEVNAGGSTYFLELDLSLKPRKGTAVIHFPSDLKGRPDERTLHQGSSAIDEKWLLVVTWSNVKRPVPYKA